MVVWIISQHSTTTFIIWFFIIFIYMFAFLCVCAPVCLHVSVSVCDIHHSVCVEVSVHVITCSLFPLHGAWNQTQVFRFGSKLPFLLKYLASP